MSSKAKLYTLTHTRIQQILGRRRIRNQEIRMQSSFSPAALVADDALYCRVCDAELKDGDIILSKQSAGAGAYVTRKFYHQKCARQKNII
jgi:hypothetical protein